MNMKKKNKKNNIASVLWSIGKMESIFKYINYVALYNTRSKYFLRKLRNLQFCLICMVFDLAPCCSSKNAGALSAGANARYYLPITAGSSSRNTARGNKFPWRKSKGSHRPCTSAVEACHRDECRTIPSRRYLYPSALCPDRRSIQSRELGAVKQFIFLHNRLIMPLPFSYSCFAPDKLSRGIHFCFLIEI